jgi:hypothetical protein
MRNQCSKSATASRATAFSAGNPMDTRAGTVHRQIETQRFEDFAKHNLVRVWMRIFTLCS